MRGIVAEARPAFPDVEFGLTGLPVLETDEMVAAEHDTELASWLAIAGVTLLFFLVYRGLYYPLLTVGTLLIGTAWALGWLTLTVGHLNILSATFAVMLIGMGDYGVLWVMRYEQARRRGLDVRSALLHTTTHVAVGNLTAADDAGAGLLRGHAGRLPGGGRAGLDRRLRRAAVRLRLLHRAAGAADAVRPPRDCVAVRRVGDERRVRPADPPSAIRRRRRAGCRACRAGRGWVVGGGAGCWPSGWASAPLRVRYDHNLLHLQAHDLDSVKWEMTLIEHTAGASWHALSYTDTPEEALALKARYEKLPEVSRVVEVASLVPPRPGRKAAAAAPTSSSACSACPSAAGPSRTPGPTASDLRAELTGLLDELLPAAASADGADGAAAAGRAAADAAGAAGHAAALRCRRGDWPTQRLQDFDERLAGDLAEDLHRLRDVATPAPITLADLPPACASATSAGAASGCCASSPRNACGTSSRWSTSPQQIRRPSIPRRPASRSARSRG